ncbi:hypothetical protein JD77_04394 [Micromonospora olivasterospora]|uniref:Short subunit dehydrogenase n=1 Tax=Micromonospora olivasterospora TaxID=1880 RepID=A0A562IF97_MICOL|nr:hypothetical protein [Micromonospora olivasterospora]TWH69385.1 hypothetical protein JD77_04394 [Micromonospora olivasterospora]
MLWAAEHTPRELNVGGPTWQARLGNILFPGLLDRKLARDGYDAQQTDTPIDPVTWRDNLDRPRDGHTDHGAEGVFADRARARSAALWVSTHKPAVSTVGLLTVALAAAGLARRLR